MKTTIDIDEARLKKVMRLTGVKTRKAAVDYALREAEKAGQIDRLVREALPGSAFADAVDPAYDVCAVRTRERQPDSRVESGGASKPGAAPRHPDGRRSKETGR